MLDKIKAVMLGHAVGDALGVPVEFAKREELDNAPITSLIAQGDMISFLPDFVTKEKIENGELCYLDIKDMNVEIWKQLI